MKKHKIISNLLTLKTVTVGTKSNLALFVSTGSIYQDREGKIKICLNKRLIICVFLLLFVACKEEHKKIETYYYKEYYYSVANNTSNHSYCAMKIIEEYDIRKQITYIYSDFAKEITHKTIEYYKLLESGMLLLKNVNDTGKLYLSTKFIDSCITYNYDNEIYNYVAAKTHCFLGEEKMTINKEKDTINSYVFHKAYGIGFAVVYKVFYDNFFIPIKTEIIAGDVPIDSVIRTNSIPYEFELLLREEQEWNSEQITQKNEN